MATGSDLRLRAPPVDKPGNLRSTWPHYYRGEEEGLSLRRQTNTRTQARTRRHTPADRSDDDRSLETGRKIARPVKTTANTDFLIGKSLERCGVPKDVDSKYRILLDLFTNT